MTGPKGARGNVSQMIRTVENQEGVAKGKNGGHRNLESGGGSGGGYLTAKPVSVRM